MDSTQLTLECPYCHWIIKDAPPDKMHFAYSFEEPLKGSFYDQVITQSLVCRNPKCKKSIRIYWYAPLNYFNKI